MTMKPKYALSRGVLKGYKPEKVRYLWYVEAMRENDSRVTYHSGFTYNGLTAISQRGNRRIINLRVADLIRSRVYNITDVDRFLKLWGEFYFDPGWRIPKEVREVE